jgi:hypothetical protein
MVRNRRFCNAKGTLSQLSRLLHMHGCERVFVSGAALNSSSWRCKWAVKLATMSTGSMVGENGAAMVNERALRRFRATIGCAHVSRNVGYGTCRPLALLVVHPAASALRFEGTSTHLACGSMRVKSCWCRCVCQCAVGRRSQYVVCSEMGILGDPVRRYVRTSAS